MSTTPRIHVPRLLEKKRDGGAFTRPEIDGLIEAVTAGELQDAQLGALLMAVYLKGMSLDETMWLTAAMVQSGEVLTWPDEWRGLMADKHSTGGVGDKVSLPLAPALAACGLKVPMISGRGLGHTGGTLDKLESIPGFQVSQTSAEMLRLLTDVGCCIVGQTETLVPADRVMYATRDITGTVGSLPLIAASIISKKKAEDLTSLVLDVKTGKGAVMAVESEARELAKTMVGISNGLGIKTTAVLTDMTNPIGFMIGNALEVEEAIDCLRGTGPEDLRELVTYLGGQLLMSHGKAATVEEGAGIVGGRLDDGSALETFRRMLVAQGVTETDATKLCYHQGGGGGGGVLPRPENVTPIYAQASGYVTAIDSMACARVSGALGAGRAKAGDQIDYAVGLQLMVSVGIYVKKGEAWLRVHHNGDLSEVHVITLAASLTLSLEPPAAAAAAASRILDVIAA